MGVPPLSSMTVTRSACWAASFAAAELVDWFSSRGWIQAEEGVEAIMAKAPYCMGCTGDRSAQWSVDCEIRVCCIDEKGLEHCGKCKSFVCGTLDEWSLDAEHHALALERIKRIEG